VQAEKKKGVLFLACVQAPLLSGKKSAHSLFFLREGGAYKQAKFFQDKMPKLEYY